MGNQQSYQQAKDHPRFSKVQYSSNSLAMIIRQPILSTQQVVEPWLQKNKLYAHIYNSNDIIRPIQHRVQVDGLCSDASTFVAKFDDKYVTSLKEQISARQLNKTLYTEQQMWHLLLLLTRCASHIYSYGEKHIIGNIHPYNILINRKGQYKILCTNFSYSIPAQLDHFEEYRLHGDSKAFVSPQLLGFLSNTKYSDYPQFPRCVDKQACEAFCLGLTLLSMATLQTNMMKIFKAQSPQESRFIYSNSSGVWLDESNHRNANDNKFPFTNGLSNAFKTVESIPVAPSLGKKDSKSLNSDIINQEYYNFLLDKVKQNYSNTFTEMLTSFLHSDPDIRIKADRLYRDYLTSIEKEIQAFDKRWLELAEEEITSKSHTNLSKSNAPESEINSNTAIHQSAYSKN